MPRSRTVRIAAFLLLSALTACSLPASLRISDGGQELSGQPIDYGRVALSQRASRVFTVSNIADRAVTLQGIRLDVPFSVATESTCQVGVVLSARQGSCLLAVAFAPREEGGVISDLELRYLDGGDERSVSAWLRGAGFLDCSLGKDLAESRAAGVAAAEEENARQRARGEAAGRALTYDDGFHAGYAVAYADGKARGYDDPAWGYPAAYASAYPVGHARGLHDAGACADGTSAGASVGAIDGTRGGELDGYHVGYVGTYDAGYARGAADCESSDWSTSSLRPPPAPLPPGGTPTDETPSDPALVAGCRDQGYDATHRADAYDVAYRGAAQQNADYQRGLAAGDSTGASDGEADGRAAGSVDGRRAGDAVGYADGAKAAYDACYDSGYANAYASGYASGYNDPAGYGAGASAGDYDGYLAGYATCPSS